FAWTLVVLWLARTLGTRLLHWLNAYRHGGWIFLGAAILVFAAAQCLRRVFANFDARRAAVWLGRWRRWEFWPPWLFYPPVAVYYLWLAVKHRGLMLPTAANPGIFSGG